MKNGKDFSVLKWFVFPPIIAALSVVIMWFNVSAFGWNDSMPYLGALGVVFLCSLVLCYFCGHRERRVRRGAFTFEVLAILALVLNATYSFSAQRDLSITKQAEGSQKQTIAEISKLRSRAAQRDAIGKMGEAAKILDVFGKFENVLRLFMVSELIFALGGVLTVYGLTAIRGGQRSRPRGAFTGQRTLSQGAFPGARRVGLTESYGQARSGQVSNRSASGQQWSETDQNLIKLIPQDTGVRVCGPRGNRDYIGHISWSRWSEIDSGDYDAVINEASGRGRF